MTPSFPLLIKPSGAACNLRCDYCFYLEKDGLYPDGGRMDVATLERITWAYMQEPMRCRRFIWQGGEPLLMGLDFFQAAVALQKSGACDDAPVENYIQTNGVLLDEAWAKFFAAENFLVGVSLDGPEALHNRFRRDAGGKGSHAAVLRGLEHLGAAGCAVNILTLVTRANAHAAKEIFVYLRELGFFHQQFIPCVDTDAGGRLLPWSIGGSDWGRFLIELYDVWAAGFAFGPMAGSAPSAGPNVSIRYFDSLLHALMGGGSGLCHAGGDCRQYLVIERNGDVYPCDFYVEKSRRLGLAGETPWSEMLESPAFAEFGQRKLANARRCRLCAYYALCAGDCPRQRGERGRPASDAVKSRLCKGYTAFFRHALPGLRRMATAMSGGPARNF